MIAFIFCGTGFKDNKHYWFPVWARNYILVKFENLKL